MYKDPTRSNTWQYGRIIKTWSGRLDTMYLVSPESGGCVEYDPHMVFMFAEYEMGKCILFDTAGQEGNIGTQNEIKLV